MDGKIASFFNVSTTCWRDWTRRSSLMRHEQKQQQLNPYFIELSLIVLQVQRLQSIVEQVQNELEISKQTLWCLKSERTMVVMDQARRQTGQL